ncbi:hypothetical protein ACFV1N_47690 [Streptosporangium canum]|uniref:hypothetical protein n=1 Tax=Streptosporangium canum TaxID=324952 RepID=UPI0036851AA2
MKTPTKPIVALLAAVSLTACASPQETPSNSLTATTAAQNRATWEKIEASRADCMKQAGFKYTPTLPEVPRQAKEAASGNGSYDAMMKQRSKYGFGVFAKYVYPDQNSGNKTSNPNLIYMMSLKSGQLAAYNKADEQCFVKSLNEVTGKRATSRQDYEQQRAALVEKYYKRMVDSDPELLDLGRKFADCLKQKGYQVPQAEPQGLASRGWTVFSKQASEIGAKAFKNPKPGVIYEPDFKPAQANPYLKKEIKAALDDLECGKSFYAAYYPKANEAGRQAGNEFGLSSVVVN